jgi:hypothetical protein
VTKLLRRYAALSNSHPWALLGVLALITGLAIYRGVQIEVDAGLESLLPADAPSVVALEEARARRGGTDLFVIAVESPEPLATVQFVEALAEELSDWEEVEYTDYVRDQSFFRSHALLYLTYEDLANIEDNLRRMIRRRLGREHPLFEDLETPTDEAEDDWEWRDWRIWVDPFTFQELNVEEDAIGSLFPFLANEEEPEEVEEAAGIAELTPEEAEAGRIREARWDLPDEYQDYRIASHGRVAVFAAKLRGRSTNVEYSRAAYERAQAAIAAVDPTSYHPELRAHVAGGYQSFQEVQAVIRDATRATQIALVLIVFLLIGFFRNLRSLYIVTLPLLMGVAWTLGLLELIYGRLNTLTIFVFSMLVGMGIDFSIHIYRRILEERAAGATWEVASFHAISRTGRALLTATVTTVVALLMLSFASFDGFQEFGIACATGVATCLLSAVLGIPPLVAASERIRASKERPAADGSSGSGPSWLLNALRVGAVVVVLAAGVGVVGGNKVEFEYDFGNLSAPKDPDRIRYGSALGRARSSAPAILLAADEAQMREVHAELSRRMREGDPLLRGFTTIATAVPDAAEQERRMAQIDEIYSVLDRRAVQRIDGDEGEVITELTELTDVEPFTLDDLPTWSVDQIRERDGAVGGLGLLFGDYVKSDALSVSAFQEAYASVDVPSGSVRVSTNGFIIADVVHYVQADGKMLAMYVSLAIFLVLLIDLRSLRAALICISTIAAAAGVTLLGMQFFGIKLGLYNIIVLPTVLGVGIDGAIHIYHRYAEDGVRKTGAVMRSTGTTVAASSLTTAAGFVGLLMIEHNGIKTIGALAVLGICASMVASLTMVAALLGRSSD